MENAATTFGKICKKAQTALVLVLMARQCWRPSISDMMEKWERQQGAQKAHATPLPKMVLEYNIECFLITLCVFRSKGCIGDSQLQARNHNTFKHAKQACCQLQKKW